jgi:hypothetical protein
VGDSVQRIVHPRIQHQSGWDSIKVENMDYFGWTRQKKGNSNSVLAK